MSEDGGGNAYLLRWIQDPRFSIFQCISQMVRYSDNVGIHWRLCKRLTSYPTEEVEFYLPQLVQVVVAIETESAALEDFLLKLCSKSPHCTLLVFWLLQAALSDLADLPQTYGFGVAKRLYNKLQLSLFSQSPLLELEKFRENAAPAIVMASMMFSSLVPQAGESIKPLVVAQGRRQRIMLLVKKAKRALSFDDDDDEEDEPRSKSEPPVQQHLARSMPNLHEQPVDLPIKRRGSGDIMRATAQRQLIMNYFRCQTQFVYSLQSIANKLVSVPKQARLSALQLELALLNRDLPAEVDIPWLLPAPEVGRQHRIVRISPTEATVLNSAEKAPYLLLIEYLKDDITFDPDTERNRYLLRTPDERKYLFERTFNTPSSRPQNEPITPKIESQLPLEEKDISIYTLDEIEQITPRSPRSVVSERLKSPEGDDDQVDLSSTAAEVIDEQDDIASLVVQMRTASVVLAQLDSAEGAKLPKADIAAIKAKIINNMQAMGDPRLFAHGEAGDRKLENDLKTSGLGSNDDPSAANLGEDWQARKERVRRSSPYGVYPNWDLFSVIVKTGDDLRQEALASQLIQTAQKRWYEDGVDVWVKKMGILVTGSSSGLVETITNGLSIHSIKKALSAKDMQISSPQVVAEESAANNIPQLSQHFENKFGKRSSRRHQAALQNFIKSLAGYSLLCYLLQIKDRHNGNILLDSEGHIIHIDFGFMLSNSPGSFGFEAAPFKLTHEYVELMGGTDSELYAEFVQLMQDAFKSLRKHADDFIRLVEIMSGQSRLPCFRQGGASTTLQLRQRFHLHMSDSEIDNYVENTLIFKSYGSVYTRLYDQFQMVTQGIYS